MGKDNPPETKRCPRCFREWHPDVPACSCGHFFADGSPKASDLPVFHKPSAFGDVLLVLGSVVCAVASLVFLVLTVVAACGREPPLEVMILPLAALVHAVLAVTFHRVHTRLR